jgi:hypothetical protein
MYSSRVSNPSIVSINGEVSLEEMTQGLDWVRWLLQGVRQRSCGIVLPCLPSAATVSIQWRHFIEDLLSPALGPCMLAAMDAALTSDEAVLLGLDSDWERELTKEQAERSRQAGALLLEKTAGARYQGVLGFVRQSVAEGSCVGHIGIVWPAVAAVFQLSPVTALAEYMRLEWETCTRDLPGVPEPTGDLAISHVVQKMIRLSVFPRELQARAEQGLPVPVSPMQVL